jgi:tetratricopeptide (TPR) repeat protein
MRRLKVLAVLLLTTAWCVLALSASAASLNARMNEARALLEAGEAQAALDAYTELLVEDPESEFVRLGIACATYRLAENALNAGDKEQARERFKEAESAFTLFSSATDWDARAAAAFDAANATTQLAKMTLADAEEDPNLRQDAIDALRGAVRAYENVLIGFPGHAGAQQNLDHLRFLLKTFLQQKEEEQPEVRMFSYITNPQTDLPGAVVEVLPPTVPQEGEAEEQDLPPAGNTAVLRREPQGESTP